MPKKKVEKAVMDKRDLEVEVYKKGEGKAKQNAAKIILFIVKVLIVLAVIYVLTSAKEVTTKEEKNITVSNPTIVQEPYQVTEEYQEKVPYGDQYCVKRPMNFTITDVEKKIGTKDDTVICSMNLTNLENKEGTRIYDAYLETFTGRAEAPELSKTVDAGATVTYSWEIELPPGAVGANCIIFMKSLPSMTKCFYPEPITYRIVTKTRTITKYRNVTQTEESTVANVTTKTKYVNRFFGYEQGYYFGW
ncbi:hypothetical protein KY308_01850 [Candidatus Woesearchaeota archaeon]|nr:hypothetical protein [Candidatus Woesearchaeota archaeon]